MLDRHVRSVKVAVLVAGVKVAPALEGVVVEVVVLPKVVVDRKTSLAASDCFDSQWWNAKNPVMPLLKSRWRWCSMLRLHAGQPES